MSESEMYSRAEKIVDEKIGFYHHLYSYIFVNLMLAILNILSSPNNWWFMWVSFFWGFGLVSHFLKTFVFYEKFDEKLRDSMIEKEIEKMRRK
ncbi:2TM domain-containing protein [Methanobrevibacter olleyae]|uniref:2TM domain-containing protein n=1 Tax=Methanobrevibacter olleyae TaxID=294671 RepID=A0A126QYF0_METOL|nr:2TM domain-containing protein [Methanobrevibacter olleyae]AMK14858.1 hypothetical protein YLM1_0298 [Methanobrevibacter olleyae]